MHIIIQQETLPSNRKEIFGIRNIIIPCVDHSSIKDQQLRERFQEVLSGIVSLADTMRR